MTAVLITGGLGQLGLGVAEEAHRKGYAVTLVGRSGLEEKPEIYRSLVSRIGARFHAWDVYDTARDADLVELAQSHQYWIHAAEPAESPVSPNWIRLHTQYLYAVAKKAGFVCGNSAAKQFVRIGSSPSEIWEDERYEAQFGRIGYVEDQPLDEAYCAHPSFSTPYFQTKTLLKDLAKTAFDKEQVAVLTASPTVVFGPYGYGPYKAVWQQLLQGNWLNDLIYPTNLINVIPLAQAAEGILLAAERGKPGERYQIAGTNVVMGYFLDRIRTVGRANSRWSFRLELPIRLPDSSIEINSLKMGINLSQEEPVQRMGLNFQALKMIGCRSAQKARDLLYFDPGGWGQIDAEIRRMREWYEEIGVQ